MKNHRNLGFIIPLLHYAALAVAQNHVPEQAVNLGDASFLDGVAGPGIVVQEIADGTHGNEIVDANGHKFQEQDSSIASVFVTGNPSLEKTTTFWFHIHTSLQLGGLVAKGSQLLSIPGDVSGFIDLQPAQRQVCPTHSICERTGLTRRVAGVLRCWCAQLLDTPSP
jgi:hypothetical protein